MHNCIIKSAERSVEQLKHRFYSIQRALIRARYDETSGNSVDTNPQFANAYNYDHECDRKIGLEEQFSRTKAEVSI